MNNLKILNGEVFFVKAETSTGVNISGGSVVDVLNAHEGKFDHVIMSCENITDDKLNSILFFEEEIKRIFSFQHVRIVHIRDFFNSYASQFSWFEKRGEKVNPSSIDRFKESWRLLAGAFFNESLYSGYLAGNHVFTHLYNGFAFDEEYRNKFTAILGIANSPLRQDLSKFGGGGNTFFSNAEDYKVEKNSLESRWELVDDVDNFVRLIDQDTLELANKFSYEIGRSDLFSTPYKRFFPA